MAAHYGVGVIPARPRKPRCNPQIIVPNIFWAKAEDYRKAVQRVYHAPAQESFIELPLVGTP